MPRMTLWQRLLGRFPPQLTDGPAVGADARIALLWLSCARGDPTVEGRDGDAEVLGDVVTGSQPGAGGRSLFLGEARLEDAHSPAGQGPPACTRNPCVHTRLQVHPSSSPPSAWSTPSLAVRDCSRRMRGRYWDESSHAHTGPAPTGAQTAELPTVLTSIVHLKQTSHKTGPSKYIGPSRRFAWEESGGVAGDDEAQRCGVVPAAIRLAGILRIPAPDIVALEERNRCRVGT